LNMSYISSPHTSFSYDEKAIQEALKDIDIGIMSEFESASNNLPNKNINRRALADLRYALGPPQLLPLSGSGSREISFKRWYDRDTTAKAFTRYVREIAQDYKTDLKFTKEVMEMLHRMIDIVLQMIIAKSIEISKTELDEASKEDKKNTAAGGGSSPSDNDDENAPYRSLRTTWRILTDSPYISIPKTQFSGGNRVDYSYYLECEEEKATLGAAFLRVLEAAGTDSAKLEELADKDLYTIFEEVDLQKPSKDMMEAMILPVIEKFEAFDIESDFTEWDFVPVEKERKPHASTKQRHDLGRGGAKRRRQVSRDNIQGIMQFFSSMRPRCTHERYELACIIKEILEFWIHDIVTFAEHDRCKTVLPSHVLRCFEIDKWGLLTKALNYRLSQFKVEDDNEDDDSCITKLREHEEKNRSQDAEVDAELLSMMEKLSTMTNWEGISNEKINALKGMVESTKAAAKVVYEPPLAQPKMISSVGKPPASLALLLSQKGILHLYYQIMKYIGEPVASLTELIRASPDEIVLVLEVLATLEMSLPHSVPVDSLDTATLTGTPASSYASTALNDLPRDPSDILSLDTVTRRMFAGSTNDIKSEYLDDPYHQLYDIYTGSAGWFGNSSNISTDFKPQTLSSTVKKSIILCDQIVHKTLNSFDVFRNNWKLLTGNCFDGVDLSNCFIAGGSIMRALTTIVTDNRFDENYYGSGGGDIDIFVYGLNETEATARLQQVLADVSKKRREINSDAHNVVVHSKHATTLVGCYINGESEFPPVQFILRVYRSATEVLLGFDVDSCCVGMGSDMKPRANARGWRALVTGVNAIDLTRRSPSYERRLIKYSKRGFGVYIGHGFNKENVNHDLLRDISRKRRTLSGLARLLYEPQYNGDYNYLDSEHVAKKLNPVYNSVPVSSLMPVSNTKSKYSDDNIGDYSENIRTMPNYTHMSSAHAVRLFEHEHERNHNNATVLDSVDGIVRKHGTSGDVVTFIQFKDDSDCDYMNISKIVELKWLVTNPGSQGKLVKSDDGDLMTGSFAPINDSVQSWFQDSIWNKNYRHVDPPYTTLHSLLLGKPRNNGIKPEQVAEIAERSKMSNSTNEVDAAFNLGQSVIQTTFNPRYYLGISKVCRQIHPNTYISNEAMRSIAALNAMISSMLMNQSINLVLGNKNVPIRQGLSSREIQTAVRIVFPGELAKYAVSEGVKAVTKYQCSR